MTFLICADEMHRDKILPVVKKFEALGHRSVTESAGGGRFFSADMLVSVGGDGSMLRAAQRALEYDMPVFGINAGRIGFLCAFDYSALPSVTEEDLNALRLNRRMLLEVIPEQAPERCYYAVNDVVLSKGGVSKTVELSVDAGGRLVGEYRADGVIVSTPTGSTGYSLSAGGPIVEPSLDIVLITPICAHAMFSRSIALSGEEEIRIRPSGRNDAEIFLSVDSSYNFLLERGSGARVKKSGRTLKLMSSDKRDYFEMISRRIAKGE